MEYKTSYNIFVNPSDCTIDPNIFSVINSSNHVNIIPNNMPPMPIINTDPIVRNTEINRLYRMGYRPADIAKQLNISKQRADQLIPKTLRIERDIIHQQNIEAATLVLNVFNIFMYFVRISTHNIYGYQCGCRCTICTRANTDSAIRYCQLNPNIVKRQMQWQKDNKDKTNKYHDKYVSRIRKEFKEGTYIIPEDGHNRWGYKIGCRCSICKDSINEYNRNYIKKLKETKQFKHGTLKYGYQLGCRCDLCVKKNNDTKDKINAQQRDRYALKRQKSLKLLTFNDTQFFTI